VLQLASTHAPRTGLETRAHGCYTIHVLSPEQLITKSPSFHGTGRFVIVFMTTTRCFSNVRVVQAFHCHKPAMLIQIVLQSVYVRCLKHGTYIWHYVNLHLAFVFEVKQTQSLYR
jgi:hypothetical protein